MVNILADFSIQIIERFIELVSAPIIHTEMLWIMSPFLISVILTEIYYSRYKEEKTEWGSSLENSTVLLFVSLDLLRYLYIYDLFYVNIQLSLVFALIFVGVFLFILDYFHALPPDIGLVISSKAPLNFLALIVLLMVYTNTLLDSYTIGAILILMVLFYMVLTIIHWITPKNG